MQHEPTSHSFLHSPPLAGPGVRMLSMLDRVKERPHTNVKSPRPFKGRNADYAFILMNLQDILEVKTNYFLFVSGDH